MEAILDLQRWEIMSDEKKHWLNFNATGSVRASDTVGRLFVGLIIAAITTIGGFGYTNLQTKYENLNAQFIVQMKKDTETTKLLIRVQTGIEAAAKASKEPVRTKLKETAKEIEDHLKQSQAEQTVSGGGLFGGQK